MKPESKKPLTRYGIDRNQLSMGKIPEETIDRIFRALFVYSLGFYEMLTKSLKVSPQKDCFQSAIWKVFAILLEYCCKTNYQMLIGKIQEEHKVQLEEQEKEFTSNQEKMFEVERKLVIELDEVKRECFNLSAENKHLKQ